jgi:hypothetical protein
MAFGGDPQQAPIGPAGGFAPRGQVCQGFDFRGNTRVPSVQEMLNVFRGAGGVPQETPYYPEISTSSYTPLNPQQGPTVLFDGTRQSLYDDNPYIPQGSSYPSSPSSYDPWAEERGRYASMLQQYVADALRPYNPWDPKSMGGGNRMSQQPPGYPGGGQDGYRSILDYFNRVFANFPGGGYRV